MAVPPVYFADIPPKRGDNYINNKAPPAGGAVSAAD